MVIFVGDKPSPRMAKGAKPFEGAVCEKRLMEWIKFLDFDNYHIINQIDSNWTELYSWSLLGHKFVALGNNVSKALGSILHFKLPHPSLRNRQHNNPEFIKQKLEECKDWLNK